MVKKLKNMNLYQLELPFKIIYFIFAFFTYCNLTFMRPIMSVAVDFVLLFGCLVAIPRLIRWKSYLRTPGLFFAVAFLISFVISAIANVKYGCADNFKGFIWMALHFFTLFACDMERSEKEYQKEFRVLSYFFLAVMLVMSFASFVQLLCNYSAQMKIQNQLILQGLVWGRLWGVFTDPNYGSVFAVIAILFSVYYWGRTKNRWLHVALGVNILIQILYIAFSGSRTGLVTLFLCVFSYAFLIAVKRMQYKQSVNILLSLVLAVVLAFAASGMAVGTKEIGRKIVEICAEKVESESFEENILPDLEGGREEDIKKDISNRRFDLWKSSVEIFAEEPLCGTSFYNLQRYALEEMPETYLVNNDRGQYANVHNMIFNILAGQGILGIGVFLAFMVYTLVFIFKRIFTVEGADYAYLVIMLCCMLAGFVSSMFLLDVIYVNSPCSLIFWIFLGYTFHYLRRKEQGLIVD